MPRFRETLTSRAFAILLATVALVAGTVTPVGAADPVRTLVPIGSDYQPDTLQQFARAAADHDSDGQVVILVLPITYSVSATSSTNGERQQNLTLADGRRGLVEDACEAVANAQTCLVQLVPALVRADAFLASNLALFTSDVDGMYILGGDQTVAMGVVADTPMEERMSALYAAGAVVGGNSAGDAVQSVNMINGYVGNNGPAESMRQGAVDLWTSTGVNDPSRGLIFGLTKAIDEQHVFEYGRTGRALNVAMTSGLPVIGMDAATGSTMLDETTLTEVVGFTSGLVIDPISYDASYRFAGPNSTLSVRDVATHLLPPSGFGYDLDALRPTIGGVASSKPSIAGRSYPAFTTPSGAGSLFLAGGLGSAPAGPAAQAFVSRAGGGGARIVVLAAGYRRATDAQADAKAIAGALQSGVVAPVRWIVLDGKTDVAAANAAVADATGIYVTAPDPSRVMAGLKVKPTVLAAIRSRWTSGRATLLADDAAASAMGRWLAVDALPSDIELAASEDFLPSGVTVAAGFDWVSGLTITTRLLPEQRWGQAYRLVAAQPTMLGVGVDAGTAVEVRSGVATARGSNVAVVLDGRKASFGAGTNGALAARWVVLDSFVDGETLAP